MWNYSYIIPSILILLVFLTYYFLRPRLPIRINRAFVALLITDLMTVFADYVSSAADEHYALYSSFVLYLVNMIYFVCFIGRAYWFARFSSEAVSSYKAFPKSVAVISAAVCVLAELITLSSPLTKAVFYIDGSGYHSGFCYNIIYITFGFYLLISFAAVLRSRNLMPDIERVSLAAANLILLTGIFIRYMIPRLLIMDIFCLAAIVVLFLAFENPDILLTERGYAYNLSAFQKLIGEWHNNRRYRILGIVIHNYNEYRGIIGSTLMESYNSQIARFLYECSGGPVFFLGRGRFAVVLGDQADPQTIGERIDSRFDEPWEEEGESLRFDLSFVRLDSWTVECSPDRLISMLLIALDNAGSGLQTAEKDRSADVQMLDRQLDVKRELDYSLQNDSVEVYLQPIVESSSGRVVAAEALARLRDSNGGIIPPDEFINIAERDGQIGLLGEQVFRKVCRYITQEGGASAGLSWINVNVSPYQLLDKNHVGRYLEIMNEYGVNSESVRFEITEEAMVDYAMMKDQLAEVMKAGLKLVLDDYGSGYSNLIRLRQYNFDNIKLDMQLVWDYCREPSPILPAFVKALKEMGLSVTAEGIEDESMAGLMTEIGCDYLQGYYYSRPVPAEEFVKLRI